MANGPIRLDNNWPSVSCRSPETSPTVQRKFLWPSDSTLHEYQRHKGHRMQRTLALEVGVSCLSCDSASLGGIWKPFCVSGDALPGRKKTQKASYKTAPLIGLETTNQASGASQWAPRILLFLSLCPLKVTFVWSTQTLGTRPSFLNLVIPASFSHLLADVTA